MPVARQQFVMGRWTNLSVGPPAAWCISQTASLQWSNCGYIVYRRHKATGGPHHWWTTDDPPLSNVASGPPAISRTSMWWATSWWATGGPGPLRCCLEWWWMVWHTTGSGGYSKWATSGLFKQTTRGLMWVVLAGR